jgi:ADP-heptose:LPS heptosyltransferase
MRRTGQFDAYLDLKRHSYVAREEPHRMVWKPGGHIIDIILANYGKKAADHRCEMYFSDREEEEVRALRTAHALDGSYVVIEPNSNETWYGDLRAWPFDRWQSVVNAIIDAGPTPVVQIGEAGRPVLQRVVDLTGRLPFRIAVLVLKHARLFLGLDGGLMNAANAVGTPAVVVWGGTSLPEFAGYPELHTIICHYVDCAPCGLRGGCPYDKKCLKQIDADEVRMRVVGALTLGTETG